MATPDSTDKILFNSVDANGIGSPSAATPLELFGSTGIGYTTGVGGAVTQATSITTGVTLNTVCGTITTVSQTVAAGAEADFVVTNSQVAATDVVVACIKSTASAGTFIVAVAAVAAGSFTLRLTNLHAANAGDNTILINFAVIKGVAA